LRLGKKLAQRRLGAGQRHAVRHAEPRDPNAELAERLASEQPEAGTLGGGERGVVGLDQQQLALARRLAGVVEFAAVALAADQRFQALHASFGQPGRARDDVIRSLRQRIERAVDRAEHVAHRAAERRKAKLGRGRRRACHADGHYDREPVSHGSPRRYYS
jgi:hypothetical protein